MWNSTQTPFLENAKLCHYHFKLRCAHLLVGSSKKDFRLINLRKTMKVLATK